MFNCYNIMNKNIQKMIFIKFSFVLSFKPTIVTKFAMQDFWGT